MQKCEDGIKEKRSGVNGDNSLYCCSVQLVHHFTGEAGKGIVAIKVDGVTEGTYVLTEDRRIEINHGPMYLRLRMERLL